MKNVGSLLSDIFKQLGIEDRLKLSGLQDQWDTIFSEPLCMHTWPVELKSSELVINVDSPAWLGELRYIKNDIETKLHRHGIKTVRFRHGSVYRGKPERSKHAQAGQVNSKKRALTEEELRWADDTTSGIADEDLREKMKRAIIQSLSKRTNHK